MSFAKWQPLCPWRNELIEPVVTQLTDALICEPFKSVITVSDFTLLDWLISPSAAFTSVNQVSIASDNGLPPIRRQTIILTNAGFYCLGHFVLASMS